MDIAESPLLCFPDLNSSCRRLHRPHLEVAVLYTLLAAISLLTVTLNLLVIISISHFKQLHTPTNALLLSLAVSDLVVGLLVMPINGLLHLETCWLLGDMMCAVIAYVSFCLISVSVGNMVLISIDRYVAICDPLLYATKITLKKAKTSICLCWACSLLYNGCILMEHLEQPDRSSSCYGECVLVISNVAGVLDVFFTFLGPCTVMVVLYMKVFVVAISQQRIIRLQTTTATVTLALTAKRSEGKAGRTLGIVICVFLMCFCPYFSPSLAGQESSTSSSYSAVLSWIMMMNSCVNPLIYALFYPWFRKAIKLIITLKILHHHSRQEKVM
ncbi:trace amine-associated receptor 13c-like [Clinocottus analis]|uniref:trace amine-associated receptor 13c-like n=1 Tax=Clinocottus analis TaxID=304258 RepID=UPI0035BFC148